MRANSLANSAACAAGRGCAVNWRLSIHPAPQRALRTGLQALAAIGTAALLIFPFRSCQSVFTRRHEWNHSRIVMINIAKNAAWYPVLRMKRRYGNFFSFPAGISWHQFAPMLPEGKLAFELLLANCPQKIIQAGVKPCNICIVQVTANNIIRQIAAGTAKIDCAANHPDAWAVAQNRLQGLAVMAADYGVTAAHEFKGETSNGIKHPELGGLMFGVMLHEGAGARASAAADINAARCGAVPGCIAGIAPDGNDAPGIKPADISRSRSFNNDCCARETHGAYTLAGIGDGKAQRLAGIIPERTANIVLAGSGNMKICFARRYSSRYFEQQLPRGHSAMFMLRGNAEHGVLSCHIWALTRFMLREADARVGPWSSPVKKLVSAKLCCPRLVGKFPLRESFSIIACYT